ncbi:MAG: hypothetical protein JW844_06235 [Candidatus Omnitrophica bacterium]|nr:hypothetical protein [Candidatus Omnitrophota bacterium]
MLNSRHLLLIALCLLAAGGCEAAHKNRSVPEGMVCYVVSETRRPGSWELFDRADSSHYVLEDKPLFDQDAIDKATYFVASRSLPEVPALFPVVLQLRTISDEDFYSTIMKYNGEKLLLVYQGKGYGVAPVDRNLLVGTPLFSFPSLELQAAKDLFLAAGIPFEVTEEMYDDLFDELQKVENIFNDVQKELSIQLEGDKR